MIGIITKKKPEQNNNKKARGKSRYQKTVGARSHHTAEYPVILSVCMKCENNYTKRSPSCVERNANDGPFGFENMKQISCIIILMDTVGNEFLNETRTVF